MQGVLSKIIRAAVCVALVAALGSALSACGGEAAVTVFPATPTPTPVASD